VAGRFPTDEMGTSQQRFVVAQAGPRPVAPQPLVVAIDFGTIRLGAEGRAAALALVAAELREVTKSSAVAAVKSGFVFSEIQGNPLPTRFPLYVLRSADGREIGGQLAARQLPGGKAAELQAMLDRQFAREGGASASLRDGQLTVSFVTSDPFDDLVRGPPDPGAETTAGRLLGGMMLHELGHAMGSDHGDKGAMLNRPAFTTAGGLSGYSPLSRKHIREYLEGLYPR
jgi:hypothetical protein